MYHPKMNEFNRRLKVLFDEVDDWLEDRYDSRFRISPNRPERGTTSNKSQDGLFNVGPQFTAGYGSEHGRGYAVYIHISTVDTVTPELREEIEESVRSLIDRLLKSHFPERELKVERDIRGLKIVGNFNLGKM
jgi:hypothetical protein